MEYCSWSSGNRSRSGKRRAVDYQRSEVACRQIQNFILTNEWAFLSGNAHLELYLDIYTDEFGGIMGHKFIFTNKFYSPKGIMATILGIIDLSALIYIFYLTYKNGGVALARYGTTGLLITVFSFVGLILGILSKSEPDRFYLFSYLGILFNVIALGGVSFVLYAGAYGL